MRSRLLWTTCIAIGILGAGLSAGRTAWSHDDPKDPAHGHAPAPPSIRITDKALHESPGGMPRGWVFGLPAGDPKGGREAFVKFECSKCHAVKGEAFPAVSKGPDDVGPELTAMGGHHPPLFFAQSLLDPNAVILDEKGYTGPDGKSKMPDFTESMTLHELIDVVAYIGSLRGGHAAGHAGPGAAPGHSHGAPVAAAGAPPSGTPGPGRSADAHAAHGAAEGSTAPAGAHAGHGTGAAPAGAHAGHAPAAGAGTAHPAQAGAPPGHHGHHMMSRMGGPGHAGHGPGHAMPAIGEATAGDYKISLVFRAKGGAPAGGGGPQAGHLMAFVKDRESGADVPYLGVTVAFAGPGTPAAGLSPMLNDHGFHYGSDMAFTPGSYQVRVSIGPAAGLQNPGGKYQRPVEVTFPWDLK